MQIIKKKQKWKLKEKMTSVSPNEKYLSIV